MGWEPDYAFYADEYGGSLPEAAFCAGLPQALAYVRWLVGFNEPRPSHVDSVKRAVCAAVDAQEASGDGESLSIGGFSVSGGRASSESVPDAVRRELFTTGLLFQGL